MLVYLYVLGFRINCCQHKANQTKNRFASTLGLGGGGMNGSGNNPILYFGGRRQVCNIHTVVQYYIRERIRILYVNAIICEHYLQKVKI